MGDLGDPIASGRASDVYWHTATTVLRRYKTDVDATREARLMTWLHEAGYPVPRVDAASGRDMVMERIQGPTMLEDLGDHPWRIPRRTRVLAALHLDLHTLTAPIWLWGRDRVPDGDRVVHLDLHPGNVILAPSGPVVIDWTGSARGIGAFDDAVTVVISRTFGTTKPIEVVGRRVLAEAFVQFAGRAAIRAQMPAACRFRVVDRNLTDGERAAVGALEARFSRRR